MGKAPLPHNKRSCYPPYPDHYLNIARIIKFKYEREKKRIMVVVVKWSHRPFFSRPSWLYQKPLRKLIRTSFFRVLKVANSWFETTWHGGHVGGKYNGYIFSWRIYMKMEFSCQRRKKLLFWTTNMTAVTSSASQQYTEIYLHKFCNRVI